MSRRKHTEMHSISTHDAIQLCKIDIEEKEDLEYWSFTVDVNGQCWSGAGAKETSRRLVRLHADVLASPLAVATPFHGRIGQIGVLLDAHQREDLLLRDTFRKLSMVEMGKQRPSMEDIGRCVHFSITVRLTPQWNAVGHFLIRDQDFLEIVDDNASFQAVKLSIQTRENELVVRAAGGPIQMFPVSPQHLNISADELCHLMEHDDATIEFDSQRCHKFFYLPRLATGKLVSISRNLPPLGPFENYTQLCTYWQQQHGYELPRDCKDMVYFNVAFTGDNTIYSYPSCCVFLRQPLIQSASPAILRDFWKDVAEILKSCPLNISPQLGVRENQPEVNRAPWHEKLRRDLQYDIDTKAFWKAAGDPATNVSKYFIPDSVNPIADAGGIVANSGGAKEQEKRYRAPVDLPKLVSAKITQFFPVTVQRFRNKITYKPKQDDGNVQQFAVNNQLHKIRVAELQKWLRHRRIPFHPKDNQQKLMHLVNKHL